MGISSKPDETSQPPVFVLVHGAFHGGWCWGRVVRRLSVKGARVFAPSQTGLGDRAHLMSASIEMETFVNDITNLIESEELEDVVLVGHSFGGRTVVGVADRMPDRLQRLVFLDGGFSLDGRSRLDALTPDARAARIAQANDFDGGVSVAPPQATKFGLTAAVDIAWVQRRMTPQPLGVETSSLPFNEDIGNGVPSTYVHSVSPSFAAVDGPAAYAEARSDWRYLEIDAPHDSMVATPEVVAEVLLHEAACGAP